MTSIYHLFFPGTLEKDVRFSWIKDTLLPNANKLIDVTKMKIKQERRLKRLITLGGLEIGIQHQIVNALELSPPPQKKKK